MSPPDKWSSSNELHALHQHIAAHRQRSASHAEKNWEFWTFECVFWCFWMWMLRKISSISQRFGSSRSSQNVYWHLKQKKVWHSAPERWPPIPLKYIYICIYIIIIIIYNIYIYIYACVCVYIYIYHYYSHDSCHSYWKRCYVLCLVKFSRVRGCHDWLICRHHSGTVIEVTTCQKCYQQESWKTAGRSLQPIPKSTYINLTWSGLSSQIWLKTMKHPSRLSQAMSLNYIVLHQHNSQKKLSVWLLWG